MSSHEPATKSFITPSGGVMTREVGAITGDVELWIDPAIPDKVRIRYADAQDAYTVVGAVQGRSLEAILAALQHDPGTDSDGNPASTDLN